MGDKSLVGVRGLRKGWEWEEVGVAIKGDDGNVLYPNRMVSISLCNIIVSFCKMLPLVKTR